MQLPRGVHPFYRHCALMALSIRNIGLWTDWLNAVLLDDDIFQYHWCEITDKIYMQNISFNRPLKMTLQSFQVIKTTDDTF